MKDEDRISRIRENLEAQATREKNSSGPCTSCRSCVTRWVTYEGLKPCCTNPLVTNISFDVMNHEVAYDTVTCVSARSSRGACKPEGKYYEPEALSIPGTYGWVAPATLVLIFLTAITLAYLKVL